LAIINLIVDTGLGFLGEKSSSRRMDQEHQLGRDQRCIRTARGEAVKNSPELEASKLNKRGIPIMESTVVQSKAPHAKPGIEPDEKDASKSVSMPEPQV